MYKTSNPTLPYYCQCNLSEKVHNYIVSFNDRLLTHPYINVPAILVNNTNTYLLANEFEIIEAHFGEEKEDGNNSVVVNNVTFKIKSQTVAVYSNCTFPDILNLRDKTVHDVNLNGPTEYIISYNFIRFDQSEREYLIFANVHFEHEGLNLNQPEIAEISHSFYKKIKEELTFHLEKAIKAVATNELRFLA